MHTRDQSSIFSTGVKFHPDYGLLLELHALTLLVACSYVLLKQVFKHINTYIVWVCVLSKFWTIVDCANWSNMNGRYM